MFGKNTIIQSIHKNMGHVLYLCVFLVVRFNHPFVYSSIRTRDVAKGFQDIFNYLVPCVND